MFRIDFSGFMTLSSKQVSKSIELSTKSLRIQNIFFKNFFRHYFQIFHMDFRWKFTVCLFDHEKSHEILETFEIRLKYLQN